MKAILAECKGLLGIDGGLVVHDKDDMKHFQAYTKDAVVVCGRKTLESLPAKLKGRTTIVLTRNVSYTHPFADIVTSNIKDIPQDAIVIGGAEIYQLLSPYISEWMITHYGLKCLEGIRFTSESDPVYTPHAVEEVIRKWNKEVLDRKNGTFYITKYTNNKGDTL